MVALQEPAVVLEVDVVAYAAAAILAAAVADVVEFVVAAAVFAAVVVEFVAVAVGVGLAVEQRHYYPKRLFASLDLPGLLVEVGLELN